MGAEQVSGEVLTWLKTLPLAPEYHPTIQEFQDPISYIFKIEKEASQYGICKIVPPVPPLSKKSVVTNFNRSIASRSSSSQTQNPKSLPTFTTRQQQVGFFPRKQRPVQQSVWQSGEHYTIQQFEAKAKGFEKSYLKNRTKKVVSGLEIETLFWKANGARPISVEYANDMPGSAFGPVKERTGETGLGASNVGDTSWNMRAVSRSDGALLRFMKEEIPGVTSPMLYVAMMFSWFAWHVEDHDLHSLNYLHFGAGKTWYGVPRDAATAFEEVIRVYGYGEEINPLVTFQVLGEKTTVMSPEVLIAAGVPCCRLVQNAGEFVVTFPRAYHTGFSHGFNCGEASNIATPEWLRFAKDAAIRRAAVNYPPMVSHFQLLYDLALDLSSSSTSDTSTALRSSRLKDKKRGERENIVKELFVEDIMQNNRLLHTLGKGSKVVLLPQNPSERFARSSLHIGSRYNVKSSLLQRLSSSEEALKPSKSSSFDYVDTKNQVDKRFITYYSRKSKLASTGKQIEVISCNSSDRSTTFSHSVETEREESTVVDGLSDRGMLSCVRCGIWPFACVAIMQPTESTSQYLMSTDFSFDNLLGLRGLNDESNGANGYSLKPNCSTGSILKDAPDGLYNQIETTDHCTDLNHSSSNGFEKAEDKDAEMRRSSALGLLALAYGNSSDSEEHDVPPHGDVCGNDSTSREGFCESKYQIDHCESPHRSYRDREFSRVDSDDSDLEKSYLTEGYANHLSSLHDVNNAGKSKRGLTFSKRPSDDSSMLHVFCLEHALELEQLLRPVGGVHIMLLCHPDFPIVERAAKLMAKEQEIDHYWHDTLFRIATKEDEEQIQLVLQREEETPKNGDWAVKLGINLYYSSILCRSPLYRKQMPYNSVIYNVFGCSTPSTSPKALGHWSSWQRKMFMAGKWCGKVWMSNQVHPFLVKQDTSEEEDRTLESRMKTEEKIVEISETAYKFGRSSAPRSARKRKSRFEAIPIMKIKPQERETAESDSDDSVDVKSHQERKRNTWKGRRTMNKARFSATEFADDNSDDSVDVGIHQEHKKNLLRKMAACRSNKKSRSWYMEMEDSEPENPGEDVTPFQGYRRNVRSQRFKGQAGSRDMEDSELEDPMEEIEPQQVCRRSVRSLRFKGQIKSQGAFSSKQPESNSDTEMEDEPGPRPRKRVPKPRKDLDTDTLSKKSRVKIGVTREGPKMRLPVRAPASKEEEFFCDLEGCTMSFGLAEELALHKKNICPVEGCYKKFFSHKYLVQHRRVHLDVRPLKCPWKGCRMTFKWAWARTEHLRVHTGARPYVCKEPGCGQTFRFVSDFSRHKRKTGHSIRDKG